MPKIIFLSVEAASCSGLFITQRVKGLKPAQVAVHCRGLRTLLGRCVVTANLKDPDSHSRASRPPLAERLPPGVTMDDPSTIVGMLWAQSEQGVEN